MAACLGGLLVVGIDVLVSVGFNSLVVGCTRSQVVVGLGGLVAVGLNVLVV